MLQKYFPKETTASPPKLATSYAVEMVTSGIVTMGEGWEVLGVGISILIEGMVVEGV